MISMKILGVLSVMNLFVVSLRHVFMLRLVSLFVGSIVIQENVKFVL